MGNKTPFYALHQKAGAKIVDFGGWDMPLNYGSQIEEHHQVRQDAGMFDVSHMTIVDVKGAQAKAFLQYLLANNVDKLNTPGKALYSGMLNEKGGVVDDLIVYYLADDDYRMVVNASTREKDLAWIDAHAADFDVSTCLREDVAMLAIQGPKARAKMASILREKDATAALALGIFVGRQIGDLFIARTGYTGEDGFEVMLPLAMVDSIWNQLLQAGVEPCGLGARDTLRLEAGMNLYGNDMDESISPLIANMAWTVALEPTERNFVGRSAIEAEKTAGIKTKLVGLVLQGKGVLRAHQKVIVSGIGEGETTSGTFSPTLKIGIAMARVPSTTGEEALVEIRGKEVPVKVVKVGFVRHGKSVL